MRLAIASSASAFLLGMVVLAAAPQLHPRVLVISVDGLKPSSYMRETGARVPTLRRLAREGAYATGVTGIWPTATFPAHTTLITGVTPDLHGIVDNRVFDPQGLSGGAWRWYARDVKVPTIVGAARAAGLTTAAIQWPVSVGMEADFLYPWLIRNDHPEGLSLVRALATPRLIEAFELQRGRPFSWPNADAQKAEFVEFVTKAFRPDVTLSYLGRLDEVEHASGPDSPEAAQSLEAIDALIGQMVTAFDVPSLRSQSYVAVVSDHGFESVSRQLRPNVAFKDAGLLKVDGQRVTEWDAIAQAAGGVAWVYLKAPTEILLQARVKKVLDDLRANPGNGIDRVLSRAELDQAHANPDASFAIVAQPGVGLGDATDVLIGPGRGRGQHGSDPHRKDMNASFILWGPGMNGVGELGEIRLTQVGPTLARLLGVSLSPLADEPVQRIVAALVSATGR